MSQQERDLAAALAQHKARLPEPLSEAARKSCREALALIREHARGME